MLDSSDTIPKPTRHHRGKYYKGKVVVKDENIVQHTEQTLTSADCGQSSNPTNVIHSTITANTTKRRANIHLPTSYDDKNKKKQKTSTGCITIAAESQVETTAETRTNSYPSGTDDIDGRSSHPSQTARSRASSQEMTLDTHALSSSPILSQNSQCNPRRNSRLTPRKRSLAKILAGSGDHSISPLMMSLPEHFEVKGPLFSPVLTSDPNEINYPEQDEVYAKKSSTARSSMWSWASAKDLYDRESTHKEDPPLEPTAEVGKRCALVIGIQYQHQIWPIRKPSEPERMPSIHSMEILGPHADARDIYRLLLAQGYHPADIRFMTDEPRTPIVDWPTHDNLKSALEKLVYGAQPNDRFFVYYAGHGIQVDDEEGDEDDGQDRTIVPCDWSTDFDYSTDGLIKDDFLRINCIDELPEGCQLIGVFDSCHSGTILGLKLQLRYPRPANRTLYLDLPEHHPNQEYNNVQPGSNDEVQIGVDAILQCSSQATNPHKPVAARVMCFSACMDSQKAYGTKPGVAGKEPRGLFTVAFTRTVEKFISKKHRNPTVKELLRGIYEQLRRPPKDNQPQPPIQDPLLTTSSAMAPEIKLPINF